MIIKSVVEMQLIVADGGESTKVQSNQFSSRISTSTLVAMVNKLYYVACSKAGRRTICIWSHLYRERLDHAYVQTELTLTPVR